MGRTSSPTFFTRFTGIAAALAATAIVMLPGQASAETVRSTATTAAVSYADLDLTQTRDARTLLRRIHLAAVEACGSGPVHSPLTPRAANDFKDCVVDARIAAVRQVDAPLVTAMNGGAKSTGSVTFAAR